MPMEPLLLDIPDAFVTARLVVRCVRPGDGAKVYEALVDSLDALRQYPASLPLALGVFANFVSRRDFRFLILLRETDTLVGCCGLHHPDWSVPAVDIGWWGSTLHRGRGLISEAVAGLIDLAFAHLRVCRVAAFVDDLNDRSARLCGGGGLQLGG